MAQTGYTPILIYSSSTTTNAPAAGSLTNSTLGSELAINITDGKLFYKDNANAVQVIAWKTTPTTAGGTGLTSYTAGDLLYYATGTTLTKLAIGSAYQALQVNAGGTAPSWQASATSTLTAQGDLLYASAANTLARLAKNTTATRYLANTGTNNNPAWSQVDLSNGVTGTLPTGNGGTGQSSYTAGDLLYYATGTTLSKLGIGAANTVLTSSGSAPQWSAGLSITTLTATGDVSLNGGSFVFNDSGADKDARFEGDTDANLLFTDASTDRVGVGTNTPTRKFQTAGIILGDNLENKTNYTGNDNIRLVITNGDSGTNTVQVFWNTYGPGGSAAAGGCLGAYDRSGNYVSPSTIIGTGGGGTGTNSQHYSIYGFIGVDP